MTLATVDRAGRPSARMVLIKTLSPSGYAVFHTHYGSRKSEDLEANPLAAGVLHWDALGRQVRVEGPAVRSPAAESDAYFATRSWRSQLNAWVSEQSRPLDEPADLPRRAADKARSLGLPDPTVPADEQAGEPGTGALERPSFWGGYRLWFAAVELWMEGPDRFHDRVRYERSLAPLDDYAYSTGPWSARRLQP